MSEEYKEKLNKETEKELMEAFENVGADMGVLKDAHNHAIKRIEKLESLQCPHLKMGIATLNTPDPYCIQHSIYKENQPPKEVIPHEHIWEYWEKQDKTKCILCNIEKPKDSRCECEIYGWSEQLNQKDKEIDRLKSVDIKRLNEIERLIRERGVANEIIEKAQSFRLDHEEWVFADELKEILEGK